MGLANLLILLGRGEDVQPVLVSAHAYERDGVNAIPAALAAVLSERLGVPFDTGIVQTNVVSHTGADGYGRLARQAAFEGEVAPGREYVMVDDFVGQGGTLANLRGWVERPQHIRVNALTDTGKPRQLELNGFLATVFQHEFDHLDGKLYIDRLSDPSQLVFENEYLRYHAVED